MGTGTVDLGSAPALAWMTILLDASIKGAVILLIAGALSSLLRRTSAATRHLVWLLAVASLIALPVLSLALPAWRLPILPQELAAVEPVTTPMTETGAPPEALSQLAIPPEPVAVTPLVSIAESLPEEEPAATASGELTHWSAWLLIVWSVGGLLVLLWLVVGTVSVWRTARRARPVPEGSSWAVLFGELAGRLGVKGAARLLQSEGVSVPMIWGLVRPLVLLPADGERWSEERRRIVLLHELAHIRRKDCLTQMVAQLAYTIYWFNPLAWLAARQMRRERERACDDLVLSAGLKASSYAGHLLEIARSARSLRWAAIAGVAMARPSNIEGRLLAILDAKRSRRALTRLTFALALIAVTCALLPLAAMRPTAAATEGVRAADAPEKPGALWTRRLSSGISVQLLGVSYNPSVGQPWWKPDGSPLSQPPYDSMGGRAHAEEDVQAYEFAIRIARPPSERFATKWLIVPAVASAGGEPKKNGQAVPNLWANAVSVPRSHDTCTVAFGLTSGPWQQLTSFDGIGGPQATTHRLLGHVVFSPASEVDGNARVNVAHAIEDKDCRVIALDREGQIHHPQLSSAAAGQAGLRLMVATFKGLPLFEVKEFQFQVRPYQWAEFQNVSLKPGHNTSVKVAPGSLRAQKAGAEEAVAAAAAAPPATVRDLGPWKKQLANGAVVEILGAGRLINDQLYWWDVAGSPMSGPSVSEADVQGAGTIIALRIEGSSDLTCEAQVVERSRSSTVESWYSGHDRVWLLALGERRFVNLHLLVSSGPSNVRLKIPLTAEDVGSDMTGAPEAVIERVYDLVSLPEGGFRVSVRYNNPRYGRFFAEDRAGTVHSDVGGTRTTSFSALKFGFPLQELAALVWRYRPPESVEFRNLRIVPPSELDAATPGEATVGFGPVIERVVNDPDWSEKDAAIDLDTGTLFSTPAGELGDDLMAAFQWAVGEGIDAVSDSSGKTLRGLGMAVKAVPNERWDSITPEEVAADADLLEARTRSPLTPIEMHTTTPPATYLFRTREGGAGILQITGFTAGQRGVKIRYKMIPFAGKPAAMTGEPGWGEAVKGLRLSIQPAKGSYRVDENPQFDVTMRNVGDTDLTLNLGFMLANGKKQYPEAIRLVITDTSGNKRELLIMGSRVAGRMDDFIVPLPVGGSYALRVGLRDYWCPGTREYRIELGEGQYEIAAVYEGKGEHYVNQGMRRIPAMPIWISKVTSGTTTFRVAGTAAEEAENEQTAEELTSGAETPSEAPEGAKAAARPATRRDEQLREKVVAEGLRSRADPLATVLQVPGVAAKAERTPGTETAAEIHVRLYEFSGPLPKQVTEHLGLAPVDGGMTATVLTGAKLRTLVDALKALPDVELVWSPRLTLYDTQRSQLATPTHENFVKDVRRVTKDGEERIEPVIETFTWGRFLDARPTISSDRRFVELEFGFTDSRLLRFDTEEKLGHKIQVPVLETSELKTAVNIPSGGAVALSRLRLRERSLLLVISVDVVEPPVVPEVGKPAPEQTVREKLQREVTLSFTDTPLEDVADFIRQVAEVNVVVDQRVLLTVGPGGYRVSLALTDVPLEDALDFITDLVGLEWTVRRGTVFVSDAQGVQAEPDAEERKALDERRKARAEMFARDKVLGEKLQRKIAFSFADTPLEDVADFLRRVGDVNIVVDQRVLAAAGPGGYRISLSLTDVPLEDALDFILDLVGLKWTIRRGVVLISDAIGVQAEPGAEERGPVAELRRKRGALTAAEKAALDKFQRRKVTFDFTETPLEDVADFIRRVGDVSIVVDQRVLAAAGPGGYRITLSLTDIPLEDALDFILDQVNLEWGFRQGRVFISDAKGVQAEPEAEAKAEEAARYQRELKARQIKELFRQAEDMYASQRYAEAESAVRAILSLDPDNGEAKVMLDQIDRGRSRRAFLATRPEVSAAEAAVRDKLQRQVTLQFTDTPLDGVVDFLRRVGDVNIVVDQRMLAAGAGGRRITVSLTDIPLEDALDFILDLVDLDWVIRRGVVFISDVQGVQAEAFMRIYDVRDIIGQVPDFAGRRFDVEAPGPPPRAEVDEAELKEAEEKGDALAVLIQENVARDTWGLGGQNSIICRDGILIVRNTTEVHEEIQRLLEERRQSSLFSLRPVTEPGKSYAEKMVDLRTDQEVWLSKTSIVSAASLVPKPEVSVRLQPGQPAAIEVEITADAASRLAQWTKAHVREQMAVVCDGEVWSVATAAEAIATAKLVLAAPDAERAQRFARKLQEYFDRRLKEGRRSP